MTATFIDSNYVIIRYNSSIRLIQHSFEELVGMFMIQYGINASLKEYHYIKNICYNKLKKCTWALFIRHVMSFFSTQNTYLHRISFPLLLYP